MREKLKRSIALFLVCALFLASGAFQTASADKCPEPAKTYSVTYKYTGNVPAGAPALPLPVPYAKGATVTLAVKPTLTGYTFHGWDVPWWIHVNNGKFSMPGTKIEITGHWTKNPTYKVTYAYVQGSPQAPLPTDNNEYEKGAEVTLASPTFEGYTFQGWKYGNNAVSSPFIMPGNKVTLKGSWCINSHTVTYETQGPAPTDFTLPMGGTYDYNDPVTVAEVPAVYEGYTFTGWTVTGATVTEGGFAMPDNDVVISGVWALNRHTVTYETHGPAPSDFTLPTEETYDYNDSVTVAAVPAVYEGYTFTGWTVTGATVTEGGFAMPDNDVVISGVWALNRHAVTYVTHGPAPSDFTLPTEETYDYNDSVTVAAVPAVYEGYTFTGWTVTGATVTEGGFAMPDNDVVISGVWALNRHTVTYETQGPAPTGFTLPTGGTYNYNDPVTVAAVPAVYKGYTFTGWTVTGAIVTEGGFAMPDNDVVISGVWELNRHTVTYKVIGDVPPGYTPPDATTEQFGSIVHLKPGPGRAGYAFVGWVTNDAFVNYHKGTFKMPDKNVVFLGIWAACSYKVSYSVSGDVPEGYNAPGTYFSKVDKMNNVADAPSREGYTFLGWTTDDATVENGEFAMPNENVRFTGVWTKDAEPEPYTVTFTFTGAPEGVTPPEGGSFLPGADVLIPEVPGHENYHFLGWKLNGEPVSGTITMPESNIEIIGAWEAVTPEPEPYTVTFTFTGAPEGVTPPEGGSFLPGADVLIPEVPGHENYHFLGWKLNGEPVSGTITMPERDIEITGAWEEVTPEPEPEPVPLPTAYYVTYVYAGSVPPGAPALPVLNAYFAGVSVNVAAAPQMAGYVFNGWTTQDATIENGAFRVFYRNVQFTGSWTAVGAAGVPQTGDLPSFLAPILMLAGAAGMYLPLKRRFFKGDK